MWGGGSSPQRDATAGLLANDSQQSAQQPSAGLFVAQRFTEQDLAAEEEWERQQAAEIAQEAACAPLWLWRRPPPAPPTTSRNRLTG